MDGSNSRSSRPPIAPVQRADCQAAAMLFMFAIVGWLGLSDWHTARHRQSPETETRPDSPSRTRISPRPSGPSARPGYRSLRPVWSQTPDAAEIMAEVAASSPEPATASADSTAQPSLAPIVIDINAASGREFRLLPRIGPKLADRIIRHRESIGRFVSVDALADVPGIGGKTLELIRPHCECDLSLGKLPASDRLKPPTLWHPDFAKRTPEDGFANETPRRASRP